MINGPLLIVPPGLTLIQQDSNACEYIGHLVSFKLTSAPHTTPRRSQVSTERSPAELENEEGPESLKSSKSGLDAAEFKALYPSINEDVGFDNTQVLQDMVELDKSIGVKIPPANPSQVKRDKKSAAVDTEDDFSKENYHHSTSSHTTFVQGLTRTPFNIFECTPFLDFIRAFGLDFAAKWPSLSELQEKMDDIKTDYPGYISRANAKHAELSAALGQKGVKKAGTRRSTRSKKGKGEEKEKEQEKENEEEEKDKAEVVDEGSDEEGSQATEAIPKESKQSLANIWRHPLESWQVTYPITDPAPRVISNRAANNAASKARTEAARLANPSSNKAASSSANRRARLSMPLPPGFVLPQPPVPTPNADEPAPQVVPVYGCDAKSLPPLRRVPPLFVPNKRTNRSIHLSTSLWEFRISSLKTTSTRDMPPTTRMLSWWQGRKETVGRM